MFLSFSGYISDYNLHSFKILVSTTMPYHVSILFIKSCKKNLYKLKYSVYNCKSKIAVVEPKLCLFKGGSVLLASGDNSFQRQLCKVMQPC
jgi:hypothetical protein